MTMAETYNNEFESQNVKNLLKVEKNIFDHLRKSYQQNLLKNLVKNGFLSVVLSIEFIESI